jgi:hypothetical protein
MRHHVKRAICLLIASASMASAQDRLQVNTLQVCSYYGERLQEDVYGFASDESARSFVTQIMRYTGLPQNFEIHAANVPNAAAVIKDGKRLIMYSQAFIRSIVDRSGTNWAATSIMAHEVGHHLAGHTLDGGSRPETELQADQFSGHVLFKMGATLEQAKVAMELASSDRGSSTHPPKGARLAAIHNGWLAAQEQSQQGSVGNRDPEPRRDPAPASVPQPKRLLDLSGNWRLSGGAGLDAMWQITRTAESQYAIVEYNLFGATGAVGVAVLNGASLEAIVGVPLVFELRCRLTVADSDNVRGSCTGVAGSIDIALTR